MALRALVRRGTPPAGDGTWRAAGAGIFNGVTKLVAQHHDDPTHLRQVVGTSSVMVLGFSTLLAVIFLLAAAPISQGLFGHTDYQGLVRLVALVQMGIACGRICRWR